MTSLALVRCILGFCLVSPAIAANLTEQQIIPAGETCGPLFLNQTIREPRAESWDLYQPDKVRLSVLDGTGKGLSFFAGQFGVFVELAVKAAREAGVPEQLWRIKKQKLFANGPDGVVGFELANLVEAKMRDEFERCLRYEIEASIHSPRLAFASRAGIVKPGVSPHDALKSRKSGFGSREAFLGALNDPTLLLYVSQVWSEDFSEKTVNYDVQHDIASVILNEQIIRNDYGKSRLKRSKVPDYESSTKQVFLKAMAHPLSLFATSNGAWIVHYLERFAPANWANGSTYQFAVFATQEAAQNFVAHHRAVFVDWHNDEQFYARHNDQLHRLPHAEEQVGVMTSPPKAETIEHR